MANALSDEVLTMLTDKNVVSLKDGLDSHYDLIDLMHTAVFSVPLTYLYSLRKKKALATLIEMP